MRKIGRFIAKFIIITLSLLGIFMVSVVIFINSSPQFGALPEGESLEKIKRSPNFRDGVFQNQIETSLDMPLSIMLSVSWKMLFENEGREPGKKLPVRFGFGPVATDSTITMTWFGHSAVLLEMEGYRLLLDPMLGPASSPVSFITKRFPYEEDINLDALKGVDAVLFSHDHYDHLDYETVVKIKSRVGHFYTA